VDVEDCSLSNLGKLMGNSFFVFLFIFLFAAVVAFGLLTVGIGAVQPLLRASAAQRRRQPFAVAQRVFEEIGQRVQESRLPLFSGVPEETRWRSSSLASKCAQAGYRTYSAVLVFVATKVVSILAGLTIGIIVSVQQELAPMSPALVAIAAGVGGLYLPDLTLRWLIQRRQQMLMDHFPDALDLIRICLEAGLGLDAAIIRVGDEFREICRPLREELHLVSLELRAGGSRNQSLRNFADRTGLPDVQALVTLLIQADRFGTGIADAVRIHTEHLRLSRKIRAEEAAATLSTKLLFPLIFLIFPALILVLLGPAAISIYQNLILNTIGQMTR